MPSFQVSGLATGLDTGSIIAQILQIERIPQQQLTIKRDGVQKVLDAYRSLNTRVKAIGGALTSLQGTNAFSPTKATSSDTSRVTASASSTAAAQSVSFTVDNLAVAEQAASSATVTSADDQVTDLDTLRLIVGGDSANLDLSGGGHTLQEVVTAINASGLDVRASAIKVADNQYKLNIQAKNTGAGNDISLDDGAGGNAFDFSTLGEVAEIVDGEDAQIQVGGPAPGGYTVTRSSNTISDLLDGVTLTLLQEDAATPVTVTVAEDAGKLADRVQTLVNAVNDALGFVRSNAGYNATTGTKGVFLGESSARRVQTALSNAMIDPVAGTTLGSPGAAGIRVERDGTISFDRNAFIDAYNDDPADVQALIGTGTDPDFGVVGRLDDLVDDFTQLGDGILVSVIEGREADVKRLNDRIADWDVRLELREENLLRQFTALETSVAKIQSQGNWLAGALGGLMTNLSGREKA
jgi:flagellar hook-associated protein 2